MRHFIAGVAGVLWFSSLLLAQAPLTKREGDVKVVATDEFGNPPQNVTVDSCLDERGRNDAARFQGGKAKISYGRYGITAHADVDYRPATFYVEVNAPNALITVSLEWYGMENERLGSKSDGWCKAAGKKIVIIRSIEVNGSTAPFLLDAEALPEPLDSQPPK